MKDGSKKSNKAKGEERGVTEMMNEFTGYGNNLQKHDVQHIGISVHEFPDREPRWLTFTLRIGEEELSVKKSLGSNEREAGKQNEDDNGP